MKHRNYLSELTAISFFFLMIISFGGCTVKKSPEMTKNLLPAPRMVEYKERISLDPGKIRTIYLYQSADDNDRFAAGLLKDEIEKLFTTTVDIKVIDSYKELPGPSVIMGIPGEDMPFAEFCSGLPSPANENEESYVIEVIEKSVVISGGGRPGLFYGVQTLIQLMEEAYWENTSLQGMTIQDWPQMKLRTVHYNYFFHLDRFEYLKESISQLAKYKVNGIVLEFEDRFKYQSHPLIAAPTSFSAEQVKELTEYAHQYHIDIIPLVQGLGHAGFILKHDEYSHLREDPEINQSCCPLREGTYEVLFDMYRETIEATPGVKYFHIGGDEVNVMGRCPLCKKKMQETGELGLYLTWLNRVNDFMKENGRTLIFWDDMPLKQAGLYRLTYNMADEKFDSTWTAGISNLNEIIDLFPRDGIFMRWNYDLARDKGNIYALDWYRDNDFKVMVASAVIGNWPLIPDYKWTPENIRSFVTLGAEKEVMGELCTAWGDDAGNHSEIYWTGFLASAEYAWNSDDPATVDRYWQKYIRRFFGPKTADLDSAFFNLSERVNFWNSGLMIKGTKNRRNNQLISLPDLQDRPEEGTYSSQFEKLIEKARIEKAACHEALKTIEKNIDIVTFNKYNLEVFASMGRLMEDHCDFVLSIGEIAAFGDRALEAHEAGNSEMVVENLQGMASVAENAWSRTASVYEEVKEVWEVSRYPKGEEGYVMNPQTNYLAGMTADLSYLILAEKRMDLQGYAEKIRQKAETYKKTGTFTRQLLNLP